jgi:hypothetical protein
MADDGSGADITIPSFLLYKGDADKIKAKLGNNELVQVSHRPPHEKARTLHPRHTSRHLDHDSEGRVPVYFMPCAPLIAESAAVETSR